MVHKALYGEDLSFFLLRLNAPTVRLVGDIEAVLKREGVISYCVYKIFGFYDALLRVWCTAEQRLQLIRSIQEEFSDAELIREFRVDKAYYDDWSTHRPDLTFRTMQSFMDKIEIASKEGDGSREAADVLLKEGLLHRLDVGEALGGPVDSKQLIKVYFALSRTAYHGPPDLEFENVSGAVEGLTLLKLKSVYTGDGFADYLIKGVVGRFGDVDAAVTQLLDALERRRLSFRPMTLLIANQDAPEADVIDVAHVDLGPSLSRLIRTLGGDVSMADISALNETRRQDVGAVYEEFRGEHLDAPFERFFLGMLEAGIRDDAVLFCERLSFIMRLEASVRGFLTRSLWPDFLGQDWPTEVLATTNELLRESPKKADTRTVADVSSLTLSDYVRVTDKLIAQGKVDAAAAVERMGDDWSRKLRGVLQLRNDVAHGNLYEPANSDRVMHRWREVTTSACAAGEVFNRLAQVTGDHH